MARVKTRKPVATSGPAHLQLHEEQPYVDAEWLADNDFEGLEQGHRGVHGDARVNMPGCKVVQSKHVRRGLIGQ